VRTGKGGIELSHDSMELAFNSIYTKFKLHYYQKIFSRFEEREASLTAVETFCAEVICGLGEPTVNTFAKFVSISQANAAKKIQNLMKKGYVRKIQSESDQRIFHLSVTEKYHQYRELYTSFVGEVVERIHSNFSAEDVRNFERMLKVIDEELMSELNV